MNNYLQNCLQKFTTRRQKIIISVAKMTFQSPLNSLGEAWILNKIESDLDFKKQLNKQLQKNKIGDLKCGMIGAEFVVRFGDDGCDVEDAFRGSHSSALDVLIGFDAGTARLGRVVDVDTKSLATDLGITQRHARRIKKKQAAFAVVQVGLFEFDGGGV